MSDVKPSNTHFVIDDRGYMTGFDSFAEALEYKRIQCKKGQVVGLGYDGDCDEDGYFMCSDGLTDDERDQVEALQNEI